MKKIKFLLAFVFFAGLLGFFLNSCTKDDFTEKDAIGLEQKFTSRQDSLDWVRKQYDDSLKRAQAIQDSQVEYTLLVVDAATATNLKSGTGTKGVTGAKVTLTQNGVSVSKNTDASGMAVFSNLKIGSVSVVITLAGYSNVNLVSEFATGATGGAKYSNLIPLIPVSGASTAKISGTVTYEKDICTNNIPEYVPVGKKVIATVKSTSAALSGIKSGAIIAISYDNLSLETTVQANGYYELTVPATAKGLTYDVKVEDFEDTQSLLMPTVNNVPVTGVQQIKTLFGSSVTSPTTVPTVSPVYVTFGDPTSTSVGSGATATAVIDNPNGVESINLTNNGNYYSAPGWRNYYTVTLQDANASSMGTLASARLYVTNGRISRVDVPSGYEGANYSANGSYQFSYIQDEFEATVQSVNGTGGITGITVNKSGRFLSRNLQLYAATGSGTGATMTINNIADGGDYWYISSVNINGGSGFVVGNTIRAKITTTSPDVAVGSFNLTSGYVSAIKVTNTGSNYISGQVNVQISAGGGSGATADALVDVNNKLYAFNITNGGSGYTSAPVVTITSKAVATRATGTVSVDNNGIITAISVVNRGMGYITAPSITLSTHVPSMGSGATYIVNVGSLEVTNVYVLNGGTGYLGKNNSSSLSTQLVGTADVKGTGASIANIHLGTGKRYIVQ